MALDKACFFHNRLEEEGEDSGLECWQVCRGRFNTTRCPDSSNLELLWACTCFRIDPSQPRAHTKFSRPKTEGA